MQAREGAQAAVVAGAALVVPAGVALLVVVVGVAGLLEVWWGEGEESEDVCHPLPPPTPRDKKNQLGLQLPSTCT